MVKLIAQTVEVRGIVATFLKFGDLHVQTASEDSRNFLLKNAARPEEIRKIIFEMHNKKTHVPDSGVEAKGRMVETSTT